MCTDEKVKDELVSTLAKTLMGGKTAPKQVGPASTECSDLSYMLLGRQITRQTIRFLRRGRSRYCTDEGMDEGDEKIDCNRLMIRHWEKEGIFT